MWPNFAAPADAPTIVCLRWLPLGGAPLSSNVGPQPGVDEACCRAVDILR